MKKIVRLTEGQLHRLIEQAINELDIRTRTNAANEGLNEDKQLTTSDIEGLNEYLAKRIAEDGTNQIIIHPEWASVNLSFKYPVGDAEVRGDAAVRIETTDGKAPFTNFGFVEQDSYSSLERKEKGGYTTFLGDVLFDKPAIQSLTEKYWSQMLGQPQMQFYHLK